MSDAAIVPAGMGDLLPMSEKHLKETDTKMFVRVQKRIDHANS